MIDLISLSNCCYILHQIVQVIYRYEYTGSLQVITYESSVQKNGIILTMTKKKESDTCEGR